jgi:hypothetical protein
MARPKTLPKFNPNIPPFISSNASLLRLTERAIASTKAKDRLAGLRWLKAFNKMMTLLLKYHPITNNSNTKVVGPKTRQALEWLRHKGNWNWQKSQGSRSFANPTANSSVVGQSAPRRTNMQPIQDIVQDRSAINTFTVCKRQ